jgi:phosphohistidine phosphatase
MKRLILVRHGKSSWRFDVSDEKRPLKNRGFKDGDLISDTYALKFDNPDEIWSSPAVRALTTAKIFRDKLKIEDAKFKVKPELYTFGKAELYDQIKKCESRIDTLMIFGHNPATTSLVNDLGDKFFDNVPTTGLVIIDFPVNSWKDLHKGQTIVHLFPKNLR